MQRPDAVLENKEMYERLDVIRKLVSLIGEMSNDEYDILDVITKENREGARHYLSALASQHSESSPRLSEIFSLLERLQGSPDFRTDSVLLLRLVYPTGKNVINRTLDEEIGPLAWDASKPCTIKGAGTDIHVRPNQREDVEGCIVTTEGKRHALNDGESIIVGRSLSLDSLYGLPIINPANNQGIFIQSDLEIENPGFSRISIMIKLEGGRIFIYERGFRNGNITTRQGNIEAEYNPNTINDCGSIGDSLLRIVDEDQEIKEDSSDSNL
ncbi:MAG: hypothetical protein ABIA92_01130 [Patescibacteria group bacterium]